MGSSEETDDYWGIVQFDSDEQEKATVYQLLWVSEKFFLQGMCQFLALASQQSQRSTLQAKPTCVYNDILVLDFFRYKQALDDDIYMKKQVEDEFKEDHKDSDE